MDDFWRPHPGQQTRFLSSPAFEALFGGAAGPGKSDCLLMESLRQIDNPQYNAILFRRTFNRLEAADGLIARSERWFPAYGGRYNASKHYWRFPSGARIYFGHMQHEWDKQVYQGAQFAYIGFDELTEFEESQYMYLFTRCRVPNGNKLRPYIRAATNPGNDGHEWVKRRFITTDIVNQIKYFALIEEKDTRVERDHPEALSRAFYPALLKDNPSSDPNYARRILLNPDPVERARLLGGDWDIISSKGRVFPNWSFLNISEEAEYNPDWRVIWGVDDGYVYGKGPGDASYHPRVILFITITPQGYPYVFDEIVVCEELSEHTVETAMNKPYKKPDIAYVDSSAAELKARLVQKSITNTGATHPVSEGIKNVRRFIQDENGVQLLKVHPRCVHTIREMAAWRYDENSKVANAGEPVPLKVDDHCPSAVRYALWHLRYQG